MPQADQNRRENQVQAKINGELTTSIPVGNGILQGDSLSPLLFNIYMNELIRKVHTVRGYRMGDKPINIIHYAYDSALVAESGDDLQ